MTLVTSIFVVVLGSIAWYNGHVLGVLLLVYPVIGFFDKKQAYNGVDNRILFRLWSLASLLILLAYYWRPLGYGYHFIYNLTFVLATCGLLLFLISLFSRYYESILVWALNHKLMFLSLPLLIVILGIAILLNTGREFMPTLDEGSYLLMPSSMPHSGVEQNKKVLKYLDMAVASLPEIETVIGKAGRMESALDPAPLSMFENMVFYKPEYILDQHGEPMTFKTNKDGLFVTKNGDLVAAGEGYSKSELIEESTGNYYRNWRPHIKNTDDIWQDILSVTDLPGVTSSPKLQPIETRLVMLQTGMRANMGIKVKGHDINDIADFGARLEEVLKKVEGVDQNAVFAERVVGKPYLLLEVDRDKIARHGITMAAIQETIEIALGGKVFSQTIEGRERYNIRVRYPRELRGSPEEMMNIYVQAENRSNIPISELVNIKYEQGAQSIKSEDGFLTSYVIFDREADFSESEVVAKSKEAIESKIKSGELRVPEGVTYSFSGSYENLVHAEKKLSWIIPLVLMSIFLILYIQFKSVGTALMIFTGVGVSLAGGFILMWLYGQSWFMNFSWLSLDFRQLFNIETINLSVAIWVGFIALFGIASDDGVVMATYLKQSFEANRPNDLHSVHASIIEACKNEFDLV